MRQVLAGVLMLLTAGCELLGGGLVGGAVTEQPSPTLPELDGSFTDSFESDEGHWPVTASSEGSTATPTAAPTGSEGPSAAVFTYRAGAYVMAVGAGRHLVPTAPVTYGNEQEVTVAATVRRLDTPGRRLGGVWGLACDADSDQNHYFAGVQTTLGVGYAGIGKVVDSHIRSIVPFGQPHEVIDADGDNKVQLRCSTTEAGERDLEFTVNGKVVAQGTDRDAATKPAQVQAGMLIDTSSLPPGRPFVVRYDDFALEETD